MNVALEQLFETALFVGHRLQKLPFPNDKAMGGMLVCHAEDAMNYGKWPSLQERKDNLDEQEG